MHMPKNNLTGRTVAGKLSVAGIAIVGGLLAAAQPASATSWTNQTGWVWLNPTGDKVGIGLNTIPAEKLQVAGGNILLDNGRSVRGKTTGGASTHLISMNPANHMDLYGARVIIESGGNVGIGAASTGSKLHVNGDINTPNNVYASNMLTGGLSVTGTYPFQSWSGGYFYTDVQVSGDLSVFGTKNFVQPHPEDDSKKIVYVAAEAGEALTLVRGIAKTEGGSVKIKLPEHFSLVTSDDAPITVQLTVKRVPALAYVVSESDKEIEVRIKDSDYAEFKDVEFNYLVQGVRDGFEDHQPIQDVGVPPAPSSKRKVYDAKVKSLMEKQNKSRGISSPHKR